MGETNVLWWFHGSLMGMMGIPLVISQSAIENGHLIVDLPKDGDFP